jgi:surface protein
MSALREVRIDGTLHLSQTAASWMFYGDHALTAFTGNGTFETSQTTDMSNMFSDCTELTTLDLTHFNTTNTTNISFMFWHCSELTTLDLTHFNTTNTTSLGLMLSCTFSLRELWLGPNTYLHLTSTEFADLSPDAGWVELTAPSGPAPVTSMNARTARNSGLNPAGHYIRASLIITVDYNNGQPDHTQTLNLDTSTAGSQRITWGTRPAPAGKVLDGWTFTTSYPTHVTLNGNTVRWTNGITVATANLTAKWRTLGTPALDLNVHADGTNNPDGGPGPWAEAIAPMPASAANDDGIRLESLNGAGRTADCTPATGTNTCTIRLTIPQLRDASDYDAPYHLKASVTATDRRDTDTVVTGTPAEQQGILPYTTINYQPGTGNGTPPASAKALTDTDSRTARITISGPSPITRPANSLFTNWQPGNIRPGPATIATSTGTTNPQGRTTINLTATWTLLDAPAGISATRDPATNQVIISGTAKANNNTDTIRLCHPAPGGGTQCHDTTTDATDTRGNRLPYDGTTEHPWHITLPAGTPDGDWSADTTLTTKDPAYPTGSQPVDSPTTRGNVHIPTPYMSTLPLTGGNNRHDLLLTTGALAAVMLLLSVITGLRNRRSKAQHRQTRQRAQAGER